MIGKQVELDALVIEALEKAIRQRGPVRLVAQGEGKPGLLEGGRTTPAKEQARTQCLDPELGLFLASAVPEGRGKTAEHVALTPDGVRALFDRLPLARHEEILSACDDAYRPDAEAARRAALREEIASLDWDQEQLDRRRGDLHGLLKQIVADEVATLDATHARLDRRRAELKALESAVGGLAPRRSEPQDEADQDFQVNACRELVSAWQRAPDQHARASLEGVMKSLGALSPADEQWARVEFDPARHEAANPLSPGDEAEVARPGWRYESRTGSLLLAKSLVRTPREAPPEIGGELS